MVSKIPAIEVSNFDISPRGLSLFNDGTGVTITPSYNDTWPFIQNGPLTPNTKYFLHHMKLHWGGSEHQINNTTKVYIIQILIQKNVLPELEKTTHSSEIRGFMLDEMFHQKFAIF